MASGRRAFEGGSTASLVSAILSTHPPLVSTLRPEITPPLDEVVRRCLEKDPDERWQNARDVAVQVRWIRNAGGGSINLNGAVTVRRRVREWIAWAAALVGVVLAGALAMRRPALPTADRPVAHLIVEAPEGKAFSAWNDPAVSPDGRHVAFVVNTATGEDELWLRPLDSPVSREVAGVKGVERPFWSPDGESLAFVASGELRRISISGGSSQRICAMPKPGADLVGADWQGDTIVFSQGWDGGRDVGRLYSVPASGGEATLLSDPGLAATPPRRDPGKPRGHHWPTLLPDGRHMLFDVGGDRPGLSLAAIATPGDAQQLLPFAARAQYRGGRLLYTRQGTLFAQGFDAARGRLGGQPLPIATRLSNWGTEWDWGWFSASEQVLAFFDDPRVERELVWFDRKAARLGTVGGPAAYSQLTLSPDEKTVAVAIDNIGRYGADLWTIDLAPFGARKRLTETHYGSFSPVWSTDGRELFYTSILDGQWTVFRRTVQGPGPERALPQGAIAGEGFPQSTTPDGRAVLCTFNRAPHHVIAALPTIGDGAPVVIRDGTDLLDQPSVSPDGRWLAYVSGDSRRMDVYVEPFGRPGQRVRVSAAGGAQPQWRGDGRELFYVAADGWLMAASVKPLAERLEVDLPVGLFPGLRPGATADGSSVPYQHMQHYSVTRDGRVFLVIRPVDGVWRRRMHVIVNWPSLLGAQVTR
jgi:Tol biopolymer transport system component